MKKYRVTLTAQERETLESLISKGTAAASKILHARILLKADQAPGGPGWKDIRIAEALECGIATIERLRQRFVEEGWEAALLKKPTTRLYTRRLGGEAEAHLVALVCSEPPPGARRWTLALLAEKLVALRQVESVSRETIRQTLKKTSLSPGRPRGGASPRPPTPTLSPAWKTS